MASVPRNSIYGPGIDEPICLIDAADGNAVYYYHLDGLGSVVALSDVNSVLVERYAYDVFGRPTIRDPNGSEIAASVYANPYLFTGRAWDAETALYYYRARYYDYYTGRFLQPDPIGYGDGLNLYSYCGNNPIARLDPWGLRDDWEWPWFHGKVGTAVDLSVVGTAFHLGWDLGRAGISFGNYLAGNQAGTLGPKRTQSYQDAYDSFFEDKPGRPMDLTCEPIADDFKEFVKETTDVALKVPNTSFTGPLSDSFPTSVEEIIRTWINEGLRAKAREEQE